MSLRQMRFSDLNEVVCLYQDANLFAKKTEIYTWTEKGLNSYPHLNLVYIQKGQIIGAVSAILQKGKKAFINDIAIAKNYRNKKYGSKLLSKIIEIIKTEKVNSIHLWVYWKNAAVIPFYYKFGFKIKKCINTKNISGVSDGEDFISLELKL